MQSNLLSHSQCAHSRPQFISVMWPDLGDHGDGRKSGLCSLVARARPGLFCERCDDVRSQNDHFSQYYRTRAEDCRARGNLFCDPRRAPRCLSSHLSTITRQRKPRRPRSICITQALSVCRHFSSARALARCNATTIGGSVHAMNMGHIRLPDKPRVPTAHRLSPQFACGLSPVGNVWRARS